MSAIRNLNGYEMHGRQLRVGFSETDKGGDDGKPAGRPGNNPSGPTGPAAGNFQISIILFKLFLAIYNEWNWLKNIYDKA